MRVLLFQPRFARLVESGKKRCTIRAKARCTYGDELSLREWTGKPYRSKQRELRPTARCKYVSPITIEAATDDGLTIRVSGLPVSADEVALADGFASARAMRRWFADTHGLPFRGELIEWE